MIYEVDIDLCEFETNELIEEIKRRGKTTWGSLMELLELEGVPNYLIEELNKWHKEPIVDIKKLKSWKQLCQV